MQPLVLPGDCTGPEVTEPTLPARSPSRRGIEESGHGRELGAAGIREFGNVKTLWIGPVNA